MFDIWVSGRMQFTDEDRRECLDTVATIIELVSNARKHSILAIEDEMQSIDDTLLRKGLAMAVDMRDPDYIRQTLQKFIIAGDYRGGALLKRIVIMEGIISIAMGENPTQTYNYTLAPLFGEDFLPEYERYFEARKTAETNLQADVEKFLNEIKNKKFPEGTNLLEETFAKLDASAMQLILRETDFNDWIMAILASSEPVVSKVFKNISKRNMEQIVADCTSLKNVNYSDIKPSQERILVKTKELAAAGRIVLNK